MHTSFGIQRRIMLLSTEIWSLMIINIVRKVKDRRHTQGEASQSSTDYQSNEFKFSDDHDKPVRSNEDSSDSD